MPHTAEKEKWLNWVFRAFVLLDLYLIVSGYIAWYQTRYQLVSPLIPKQTINQIIADSQFFEASIVTAAFFLVGVVSYTFNKKTAALVFLCLGAIAYEIVTRYHIF